MLELKKEKAWTPETLCRGELPPLHSAWSFTHIFGTPLTLPCHQHTWKEKALLSLPQEVM